MYTLTVRDHIMIAHSLHRPEFGPARALHGATYVVELTVRARELDENATVVDLGALAQMLSDVLAPLRYRNLDEHPAFEDQLTTTEALARHVAEEVAARLGSRAGNRLTGLSVVLREHPDAWAGYSLELP
ncbi:6-carboxytetrahydropterin synthase [Sinomonas sp. ASV322]|uniref:6-pyruvoyl trahydropterin synthase family protein n=1 Tax=Sinomonas sp. ASV322 TaxID=3041920 RepID=UPI0027DD298E|nr:6-carboxytetrahydropterin synthase [Sinomonas sp. ASV322]MDQ4503894.1 6-carboxytetrahydropterin synthase [Sinomonas sp. ASV322]